MKILSDYLVDGTPLRGLILELDLCIAAYVGVPLEHPFANLEGMDFPCHGGVTFSGPGDGDVRPAGWYWYGWDYAHFGDQLMLPAELLSSLPLLGSGKRWTLPEVEAELSEVLSRLAEAIRAVPSLPPQ
jgi:hypothetical protein